MIIVGIDLSSPSNPKDTALAQFRVSEDGKSLVGETFRTNLTDKDILSFLAELPKDEKIVIGLDSPLSYQDGGGGRASDAALRRLIMKRGPKAPTGIGMQASSVMSPFYISSLTMRGIKLSQLFGCLTLSEVEPSKAQLVEVHPGATIGLHMTFRGRGKVPYGVPECVLRYKQDGKLDRADVLRARAQILMWLEQVEGVQGMPLETAATTHQVDSCAAAFAAWKFATGESVWTYPAEPPEHPYPYSC